jgi:hypothetical protein
MICNKCKTRNPIGNKFCKECGVALPLDANPLVLEEANRVEQERKQEQVATLLAQAFTLSETNQVEAALPLVKEAVTLIPNSTAAHSLLATLYERLDDPEKAIYAMKRVVELNPESSADRAKLEMMQRGVHVLPKIVSPQKSRTPSLFPLALACTMVALVLTGGIFLTNNVNNIIAKKEPPAGPASPVPPVRMATNITSSANVGSPGMVGAPQNNPNNFAPPATRPDPFTPLVPQPSASPRVGGSPALPPMENNNRSASRSRRPDRPDRTERTERPRNTDESQASKNPPSVVIVSPDNVLPNPQKNESTEPKTSLGTAKKPTESTPSSGSSATSSAPKKEDNSYIRIQVRPMTAEEREREKERLRRLRERGDEMGQEEKGDGN